jgi:hypothetical protein
MVQPLRITDSKIGQLAREALKNKSTRPLCTLLLVTGEVQAGGGVSCDVLFKQKALGPALYIKPHGISVQHRYNPQSAR